MFNNVYLPLYLKSLCLLCSLLPIDVDPLSKPSGTRTEANEVLLCFFLIEVKRTKFVRLFFSVIEGTSSRLEVRSLCEAEWHRCYASMGRVLMRSSFLIKKGCSNNSDRVGLFFGSNTRILLMKSLISSGTELS